MGSSKTVKVLATLALIAGALGWMWVTWHRFQPPSETQVQEMRRAGRNQQRQAQRASAPRTTQQRTPQTPEQRHEAMYRRMELTPVQRVQAEAIRLQMEQQGPLQERAFRQRVRELMTPEQRARFDELQRRNRARQASAERGRG